MTQIRTLLNGMALNSFKRVSLASEETAMANALPRTKANFDYNGSTWVNDAAVANNPMAGVSSGTDASVMWAFSTAAISELDGKCTYTGGGHTNSGDGSIYTFDPEVAAANLNGGGSGITWSLRQQSTRYIDAFTNSRPSSVTSPEGALHAAPTTPTGTNQSYWCMPNVNGVAMPVAGHNWRCNKYLTGTRRVVISNAGGFDGNAAVNPNAGFVFSDDTGEVIGPLVSGAAFPSGASQTLGYQFLLFGTATGVCINPIDGLPYGIIGAAFASRIYKWTNPDNSNIACVDTGAADGSHTFRTASDFIMIPDPANAGQALWFQHASPVETGTDANFFVCTGFNGGTPTFSARSYGTGSVTTRGPGLIAYTYDSQRKVIWMTDGDHLFKVTPNAGGNLNAWTIAAVTGFTGDVPADLSATSNYAGLQYIAAHDCLVHVMKAGVRIYKPSDWNPPVDASVFIPYQPWYQAAPLLAT